ncbi:MAG: DUF748 domain-containing protein [Pseudomonadota bacterium]
MKKTTLLRRGLGATLGLLALYAGVGFLAVPVIVKHQAQQFAASQLQRALSVEKVGFNPFSMVLTIDGFKLMEPKGEAVFLSFQRLTLDLAGESLWRAAPVVQQFRLEQPFVHLVRDAVHHYSIDDILALIERQPPSPEPSRFSVNNIQVAGGRIAFEDQPAHATHTVEELKFGLPFVSSMPVDVAVFVEPMLSAKVNGAALLLKGKTHPFAESRDALFELVLDDVDVARYLEYLPFKPNFKLPSARLDARLTASFRQPKGKSAALVLGGTASLKALELIETDGKPLLKLAALEATLGSVDVLAGRVEIARLSVDGLDADLRRNRAGKLNFEQLVPAAPATKPATPAAPLLFTLHQLDIRNAALHLADESLHAGMEKVDLTMREILADTGKRTVAIGEIASSSAQFKLQQSKQAAPAAATPAGGAGAPYLVTVAKVAIEDWSLQWEDRRHGEPVKLNLSGLGMAAQGLSSAPGARSKVDLKATLNMTGQLTIGGTAGMAPLHADLALDLKNIGMLPLQPYVTDFVNLRITQAALSGKGKLRLDADSAGALAGGFNGDVSLNSLATVDKASANDFLSWKSLAFTAMDVRLQPFSMSVGKVALADFFARVIIDPNGRINVQDIKRSDANADQSLTEASARAQAAVPAPSAPAGEALPQIRIGALALSGGRVRFTDNFIKPNYTANLKDLGGTVNGLSSDAGANASVALRGIVNSAPLSINGRINPLKRDLSLDLKAEVHGMELSSLSAYSDKYVGYDIEKGKLTFEVSYQLEKRQLKSENRLILDQLTFGNESSNPNATKLPVRFAVALLSDRNGVIDISVPVGGSLDDPQFSMGGIVLTIIGNAVSKAVTAPFALLGSLFGGGEELSTLEFDPGHATVLPAGEAKLTTLAKALTERPGLKLDILGRADSVADREALRHVAIERKLRGLKTRELQARGMTVPEGGVVVVKEEYAALLARLYQEQPQARKNLPAAEIEKAMLAIAEIDDDDLLSLARRRSQAAKDWLSGSGKVAVERLYIVSAKLADAEKKPGVEFTLR